MGGLGDRVKIQSPTLETRPNLKTFWGSRTLNLTAQTVSTNQIVFLDVE